MPRYIIEQQVTGVVLFDGAADSEKQALDLMAQDAGAADYASIPEGGAGDTLLIVTTIYAGGHEESHWLETGESL